MKVNSSGYTRYRAWQHPHCTEESEYSLADKQRHVLRKLNTRLQTPVQSASNTWQQQNLSRCTQSLQVLA